MKRLDDGSRMIREADESALTANIGRDRPRNDGLSLIRHATAAQHRVRHREHVDHVHYAIAIHIVDGLREALRFVDHLLNIRRRGNSSLLHVARR